jgi:SAM-dependent methyltransferase
MSSTRRTAVAACALTLCVVGGYARAASTAPATTTHAKSGGHHSYSDVEYWTRILDSPGRPEWQKPVAVMDFLGIERGSTVADLGAGTGYFTIYLSTVVGEQGRVYAVDTEPAMLEYLKKRTDMSQDRVVPVVAAPDDPKLPDGQLDVVLVVNTWHHIPNRAGYLPKLQRALAAGGRVAVVDFREGTLPVGPPPEEKVSRDKVVQEFEKAGWTLAAESFALPYQYMLTFYPPKAVKPG